MYLLPVVTQLSVREATACRELLKLKADEHSIQNDQTSQINIHFEI